MEGKREDRRHHGRRQPIRDTGSLLISLAKYLTRTEVHTYAFSVAANAILSLFPFIVMMYTVARKVFHSRSMEDVVGQMVRYFCPPGRILW